MLDALGQVVVVVVETLGQPEPPVEHKRRDRGTGLIAGGLEGLGERLNLIGEAKGAVRACAVMEWVEPGVNRAMRGKGRRRGRDRVREENSLLGEAIEMGCLHASVAVGVQVVGTRRVHGDQEDVEVAQQRGRGVDPGRLLELQQAPVRVDSRRLQKHERGLIGIAPGRLFEFRRDPIRDRGRRAAQSVGGDRADSRNDQQCGSDPESSQSGGALAHRTGLAPLCVVALSNGGSFSIARPIRGQIKGTIYRPVCNAFRTLATAQPSPRGLAADES